MWEYFEMIILGIVQGLTEFLPVSSSGHLILLQNIFGITEGTLFNAIVFHLGTFVAVCIFYFKEIVKLVSTKDGWKTIGLLVIASVPAAVIGFILDEKISSFFGDGKYLCFFFLFSAVLLYVTEILGKKRTDTHKINLFTASVMGCAQGFVGIFPGISRSGCTICSGILSGGEKEETAKFSFLMSLPVVGGSMLYEVLKIVTSGESVNVSGYLPLFIGALVAGVVGFLCIKLMMSLVKKCNFKWFSLYLTILAAITFINSFVVSIW